MSLRPFFSYFGGKYRLAAKYPEPQYGTIIEPFAGSACYSVRYAHLTIRLYDLDPTICGIWDYLIHATESEIRALPLLKPGESIRNRGLPPEAEALIGYWINQAGQSPMHTMPDTQWALADPRRYWGPARRDRIASQVGRIRHWQIENCSYEDIPIGEPATWLVDPPYQDAGKIYKCGSGAIDFGHLGQWCRALPGQVMVCENTGADWLPFRHFDFVRSANYRVDSDSERLSAEALYYQEDPPWFDLFTIPRISKP